jgi:membrane-associated phospholipid phosphatase
MATLTAVAALVQFLHAWDRGALTLAEALRWGPLTAFFVLASAWWVKWPLFVAVGACADAVRRRRLPTAAIAALLAAATAGVLVTLLKGAADRARPGIADPALDPIGAIPSSASFPSGHSATAFACAVAVGILSPRLRWPLLAGAAMVAVSRVYLEMHYGTDVVAGSALGVAVGLAVAVTVRRMSRLAPAVA